MNERLKEALTEFLNSAMENCHQCFNQLQNIKGLLEYVEQQRENLKNLLKENNISFPFEKFIDTWILLENRRSEFAYFCGLQDGLGLKDEIESIKENME